MKSAFRLTSSGVCAVSNGRMTGFYVASNTGGTLVIRDSNNSDLGLRSADRILLGPCSPPVGHSPFPVDYVNGLAVDLSIGLDITIFCE